MKSLLKSALLVGFLVGCDGKSTQQIVAPFGLTWGASIDELKKRGMIFDLCEYPRQKTTFSALKALDRKQIEKMKQRYLAKRRFHREYYPPLIRGDKIEISNRETLTTDCRLKNPPKPISFSNDYFVKFHVLNGLVYVSVSHYVDTRSQRLNSPSKIDRLKSRLIDKYGDPWREGWFFDPKATWADHAGTFLTINEERSIRLSLVYESKEWTRVVDYEKVKRNAKRSASKSWQEIHERLEDTKDADAL